MSAFVSSTNPESLVMGCRPFFGQPIGKYGTPVSDIGANILETESTPDTPRTLAVGANEHIQAV